MGRDPDSKWVQWLELTRSNTQRSISDTVSASSSSCPLAIPSPSNISDSGRVRSRSSATSYFALVSAAKDAYGDGALLARHKYQSAVPELALDPSRVTRLSEREQQPPQVDLTGEMIPENSYGSRESAPCGNYPPASSEKPQPQMQSYNLPIDLEDSFGLNTFTAAASATPSSTVSSSGETTTPSQPSFIALSNTEIATLQRSPFGFFCEMPEISASAATEPFDPTGLDARVSSWQHGFPLDLGEDLSSSHSETCKCAWEAQELDPIGCGPNDLETRTYKKQKVGHSWTDSVDTLPQLSPNAAMMNADESAAHFTMLF